MTEFKTSDRDVNRAIRSWLHEDRHEDVSRIAGAVLDQVETIPQRRATWWPAWRTPIMNKIVTYSLGAAAVVVLLFAGSQILSPGGLFGTAPTPTPTVEPTPATHSLTLRGAPVTVTATVPDASWSGDPGGGIITKGGEQDGAGFITFVEDGYYVYGDPCQWATTKPDAQATTVDEVVAALSAQASRDASAPVDITLDGHTGKSITLHVPDDANFVECDRSEGVGTFASWGTATEDPARYHQYPGQIDKLWIVEVDGHIVIIDGLYGPAAPQDLLDELDAIVQSATWETP